MGQAWSHFLTALSPSWLLATQTKGNTDDIIDTRSSTSTDHCDKPRRNLKYLFSLKEVRKFHKLIATVNITKFPQTRQSNIYGSPLRWINILYSKSNYNNHNTGYIQWAVSDSKAISIHKKKSVIITMTS